AGEKIPSPLESRKPPRPIPITCQGWGAIETHSGAIGRATPQGRLVVGENQRLGLISQKRPYVFNRVQLGGAGAERKDCHRRTITRSVRVNANWYTGALQNASVLPKYDL